MPPKVLKTSEYNCSETLTKLFNDTINNCEFSDELKLAGDPTKMIQQNQKTVDL